MNISHITVKTLLIFSFYKYSLCVALWEREKLFKYCTCTLHYLPSITGLNKSSTWLTLKPLGVGIIGVCAYVCVVKAASVNPLHRYLEGVFSELRPERRRGRGDLHSVFFYGAYYLHMKHESSRFSHFASTKKKIKRKENYWTTGGSE